MKTTLLFLFVCITTGFSKPNADWYTYQNQEISIEFPKEPEVTTQKLPTAIGDIEMKIATYDGTKDGDINLAYVFISSIYPDSLINSSMKEKLPQFFRNSIDGAVKTVNGKLLSEKEIAIDGFPGREVKVDYSNGLAVIFFRMFLVQNRAYFVETISPTGKEINENASRFHKSFTLKK